MSERPQRNLSIELMRVTEAAALAAAQYMGTGDRKAGDQAAVDAMRAVLSTVEIDGVIVIGEGEKDDAPMLYNGEKIGTGSPPAVDVAVDPVEGTRLLALGRANAISCIAVAERWSMWNPGPSFYADKLVVDKRARDVIDIRYSVADNLNHIAVALGRPISELTVFVLDKPRHEQLVREIRATGARITLQSDGDVVGALLAATPGSGVDVMMGVGGTPEAVIAAAAVKALGGAIQVRRSPQSEDELQRVMAAAGDDWDAVLTEDDLIRAEDAFFAATGITDGPLLEGVHYDREGGVTTHSMVMRAKTGTVRYIKAVHQLERLMQFSQVEYIRQVGADWTSIAAAQA
ncbi:MAG: class II fructose-bisphosphatase [Chloroflexi bacterium]|nr:class II fructose-bisphosphatase [Chloroflexota bacterium]